jgi:hypothetical protein
MPAKTGTWARRFAAAAASATLVACGGPATAQASLDASPALTAALARDRGFGSRKPLDGLRDAGVPRDTLERELGAAFVPLSGAAAAPGTAEVLVGFGLVVENGSWYAEPDRVRLRPGAADGAVQRVPIELGDDTPLVMASDRVQIEIEDEAAREWKLEQRLVTTLSLSASGPHLDLSDWKHGETPWTELPRLGARSFRGLWLEEPPFPAYTQEELLGEVRRAGFPEWAESLAKAPGPPDVPGLDVSAAPGVERIEWRLSVREGQSWRVVRTLSFVLPMGC